jgi:hypothetical protein
VARDGFEGTQDCQTDLEVVSLCMPATWSIESYQRGGYQWMPKTEEWKRDLEAQSIITSVCCMT